MKCQFKISEDEIIRDWTLNSNSIAFTRKFREQYQLWIYLQICALKLLGQLLDNPNTLDTRIIGHACKRLGTKIVGTVNIPSRDATKTDYKKLVFKHLNFQQFSEAKSEFYQWLKLKLNAGMVIPEKLVPEAKAFLIASKIALPTLYYIKREINSFCSQQQEKIFLEIHRQLSESLILKIDEILSIIPGQDITWFQKFKEYPGSASISLLQDCLRGYKKLSEIDISEVDISAVSSEVSKYLYQLIRYYNAYKIKRFKPEKSYAFMVLFWVLSH